MTDTKTTTTTTYTMALCGDCSNGPPCRCSSDPAVLGRVWSNGRWIWVAMCNPAVRIEVVSNAT